MNSVKAVDNMSAPASNLRYERKFTGATSERSAILQGIRHHPSFFSEIYSPRQVNNIYLDTPDLQFYKHNVIGIARRKKVRIRWYGDTFGETRNPKVEYKLKDGLLGDKWTFDFPDFTLDETFTIRQLHQWVRAATDLPPFVREELLTLQPTLVNSYRRTYFTIPDHTVRLTFDEELKYYRVLPYHNTFLAFDHDRESYIIELKYAPDLDQRIPSIAGALPVRLSKSSKYVNGVDRMVVR